MSEESESIWTSYFNLSLAADIPDRDTFFDVPVIADQVFIDQRQVHIVVSGVRPASPAFGSFKIRRFPDAEADQSGFFTCRFFRFFRLFRHIFLNE